MKKTKVTAKDVAKYAGVSATTVSMVLSGKSERRFPEKTCRRILDACSELGYVRNHTAVNIAEEKTLAAITPTLSNMYYVHMAESMQWRARELGYSLMVFNTFREIHQETQVMQLCRQLPIAGMFFLYPPENTMLLQQIGWTKPVIHIYDKDSKSDMDVFEIDGFLIGRIIAEHLIELGHERIALISSTFETKQVTRLRRLEGLRAVYAEHGFDPEQSVIVYLPEKDLTDMKTPPEGYDLGYLLTKRLLERGENVTACVAVNDIMAIGVMDAVIDSGKRIPED